MAPDLDLHCIRINDSARAFKLKPVVSDREWLALALEGVKKFDAGAALYIRPMYWADAGVGGGVKFDPDTTRWCLCLYEAPMAEPPPMSITLSPYRRPTMETAPVAAKAGCLYPNNGHALLEAAARGFDNCLLRDMLGNIAELANANVFMVKDGVAFTPAPNGTFLSGITRARVIGLLRADGVTVIEKPLSYADFLGADEIFSSGNFNKVAPMTRIDDRPMQPGRSIAAPASFTGTSRTPNNSNDYWRALAWARMPDRVETGGNALAVIFDVDDGGQAGCFGGAESGGEILGLLDAGAEAAKAPGIGREIGIDEFGWR